MALVGTEVVLESGMGKSLLFLECRGRSHYVGHKAGRAVAGDAP
jgi:hypothetical protein